MCVFKVIKLNVRIRLFADLVAYIMNSHVVVMVNGIIIYTVATP